MQKFANSLNETLSIALAALLIAIVIAIQLPAEIYINNVREFTIPLYSLALTLFIGLVGIFLLFFLPALIPNSFFRAHYFSFLATLGILIWFNAHFLFGNYGAFDGRGLTIETYSAASIIEIGIWGAILLTSIFFSRKIQKLQLQAVSGLLIIVTAFTGIQVVQHHLNSSKTIGQKNGNEFFPEDFLTFSKNGNIIHIVLDEQQSTIFDMIIERDPNISKKLDGFIYFTNTLSNYPNTLLSIPALLTGEVYKNDIRADIFIESVLQENKFIQRLTQANYETTIFTLAGYCKENRIAENCVPMPGLSGTMSGFLLLDYSLFKAVPDIFKEALYREEEWLFARLFVNSNYSATLPGLGYLSFFYLNQDLAVQDSPPKYTFFHTLITHSPFVLQKDCQVRIKTLSRHTVEGRLDQSECAFKQVGAFIDKLKSEGIYDNTLIIISSDHGGRFPVPSQQDYLAKVNLESKYHSMGLATLLIKPVNSHGKLKKSTAPALLSDIPNTILASVDIPLLENGEDIFNLDEQAARTREHSHFEIIESATGDEVSINSFTAFAVNGDVNDARNWTLTCSDLEINNSNPCTH